MARAAWTSVSAAAAVLGVGLLLVASAPAPVPAQSLTYSGEPLTASSNWDMPPDLKIAIVGDVDLRARPESRDAGREIYRLIKAEGAQALLCQGDLTYLALEGGLHDRRAIPQAWAQAMDQELGPDFPVFAVAGNHDVEFDQWYPPYGGHQKLIFERLQRQGWAKHCRGEVGLNSLCVFKGLAIVQSGIGTVGDKAQDLKWIQTALADIDAAEPDPKPDPNAKSQGQAQAQGQSAAPHRHRLAWRVCSWHMVTGRYQTGSVPRSWYEDTGSEPYDACRQHGAFIVTGHEHAYARTHGMANFARTAVAPRKDVRWTRAGTLSNASGAAAAESGPQAPAVVDEITLSRGSSWAALVGVGTNDVRPVTSALDRNPWWGAASNAHNDGQPAVLFCTLNAGGDLSRGFCELKGIWQRNDPQRNRFGFGVADRFEMRNTLVTDSPLVPEARKREL